MSENTKKTQISIDGQDFYIEDMTDEQRLLVNHCVDLDRKIANTTFQLDQLKVGKEAFVQMLKEKLAAPKPETVDAVETVQ
jgi:hypothetical protein